MSEAISFNTKSYDFNSLRSEWSKKLKQNGFRDIETRDAGDVIHSEEIIFDDLVYGYEDYYQYCHVILREFRFACDSDRLIFELHAEGLSSREIDKWFMMNCPQVKTSLATIKRRINKIKKEFGRIG